MKRTISAILMLSILLCASSCGDAAVNDDPGDGTTAPDTVTETSAETEILPDIPSPEDADYNGYEFRVLYQITGWGNLYKRAYRLRVSDRRRFSRRYL